MDRSLHQVGRHRCPSDLIYKPLAKVLSSSLPAGILTGSISLSSTSPEVEQFRENLLNCYRTLWKVCFFFIYIDSP